MTGAGEKSVEVQIQQLAAINQPEMRQHSVAVVTILSDAAIFFGVLSSTGNLKNKCTFLLASFCWLG